MDFVNDLIDESGIDNLMDMLKENDGFNGFSDGTIKGDIYIKSKLLSNEEKIYIAELYEVCKGGKNIGTITTKYNNYKNYLKKLRSDPNECYLAGIWDQLLIKTHVIKMKKINLHYPCSVDKNKFHRLVEWFRKYSQRNRLNNDYIEYINSYFTTKTELAYSFNTKIEIIIFTMSLITLEVVNIEYGNFAKNHNKRNKLHNNVRDIIQDNIQDNIHRKKNTDVSSDPIYIPPYTNVKVSNKIYRLIDEVVKITIDIEKFMSVFLMMGKRVVLNDYISIQSTNEKENHYYRYILYDLIKKGYITSMLLYDIASECENKHLSNVIYLTMNELEKIADSQKNLEFKKNNEKYIMTCCCEGCKKYQIYLELFKEIPKPIYETIIPLLYMDNVDDMNSIV